MTSLIHKINYCSNSFGLLTRQRRSRLMSALRNAGYHASSIIEDSEYLPHELSPSAKPLGTSVKNAPVLVLNADYTPLSQLPLSLWPWEEAIKAVFLDKAVVVSEYNILVRSVSMAWKLPSVIALKQYYRKPDCAPALTKRHLFLRDGFRCQYCLKVDHEDNLSVDHVLPRSRGGKLTWSNTVCACKVCNFKKGQTLTEDLHKIGMKLRAPPHIPTYNEIQFKSRQYRRRNIHPHWQDYL